VVVLTDVVVLVVAEVNDVVKDSVVDTVVDKEVGEVVVVVLASKEQAANKTLTPDKIIIKIIRFFIKKILPDSFLLSRF
jgi:hypothetical protein